MAKTSRKPTNKKVVHRSRMTLDLDRSEAAEYGVGVDGGNDEERDELRARLIGENEEDEVIDSEDDEELDSDAAFEESDEDRFAGFFSAKNKKKVSKKSKAAVNFADVDLNEDVDMEGFEDKSTDQPPGDDGDEEEEEGEDDEFINVLDILDGKGELGEDYEGREDRSIGSSSDLEDEEPRALDELQNFISTLDPSAKKRKDPDYNEIPTDADRSRKQRRLTVKEQTEAGTENEFRARSSGSKLNLDDLLAPLASQSSALLSLKKSTKVLGSSSKIQTLSAPLPQRAQERLDREAAYDQTKEEVDKWSGTMKRIREAEHLSFPLQAQPSGRVSNLELAAKFKPTTPLESSVDALLKSAKLREEDIQNTEETMLATNKISVEEVAERRAELRKMRELMFRAEVKARRVSKIKSKTYRKIKRKEREKLGEKLGENEESEGEEGRMKREVDRAKERATLRHKHTGKWARQMKGREGVGEDGRKEIEEMLARGEKLRRKIRGVGSDDEDDEDDEDDDDGEDVEGGIEKIKQGAFDELQRIEREDRSPNIEPGQKGKSIFEMKFMKDAMARQHQGANKIVDDFIKEMGGSSGDANDSDAEEVIGNNVDPMSGVITQRVGGRIVYRPGSTAANRLTVTRPLGSLASDASSVTLKSTDLMSPPASPEEPRKITEFLADADTPNPWLIPQNPDSVIKAPRKKNEVVVGKDSSTTTKSKNKLKKQARKREEEKEKAKDDATVEISMDNVLTLTTPDSSSQTSKAAKLAVQKQRPSASNGITADDNSDVNSEVEEQERAVDLKGKGKAKGPRAFEQRDLVALAFAGDNVVQEFEEVKRREIAADAPRTVDTTIPGWGSWGGTGTRQAPPKPHRLKKIAGIDPASRADFNKANIIISETRDKKAAKYLVKDLPYPYTSKAQFERTMERPLGTEWNTRVAFQRGTLPRVVTKPGVIINPLEKLIS